MGFTDIKGLSVLRGLTQTEGISETPGISPPVTPSLPLLDLYPGSAGAYSLRKLKASYNGFSVSLKNSITNNEIGGGIGFDNNDFDKSGYYSFLGGSFSPVLDTVTGSKAALSFNKIRTAYTGDCFRVKRASDNLESNIPFVNGLVDEASVALFCGASNGFMVAWRDQSGNGNDATQSVSSQQPKVYDGSTGKMLRNENGYHTVDFDGAGQFLTFGTVFGKPANFSIFTTMSVVNNATRYFSTGSGDSGGSTFHTWGGVTVRSVGHPVGSFTSYVSTGVGASVFHTNTTNFLSNVTGLVGITYLNGDGISKPYFNNILQTATTGIGVNSNSGPVFDYSIGRVGELNQETLDGNISSFVLFDTTISDSDRDLLSNTLMIQSGVLYGAITNFHDQSGNGNDAIQPVSSQQPKIDLSGDKVSIKFDGVDDRMYINSNAGLQNASTTIIPVVSFDDTLGTIISATYNGAFFTLQNYTSFISPANTIGVQNRDGIGFQESIIFPVTDNDYHLIFHAFNSVGVGTSIRNVAIDSVNVVSENNLNVMATNGNTIFIGDNGAAQTFNKMLLKELIIYPSDKTSDQTGIENNINNYYSIY